LLEIHEKYYAGDISLKHNLVPFRPNDISGLLENIVFLKLLARGYQVTIGKINDPEIDFIAIKNNRPLYIQVAYLLTDDKTVEREFGALEKIRDNHPKLVVSMDQLPASNQDGIQWLNLVDFLLGKER
jgi:predicted AAA+ superfamily ATPase